MTTKSIITYYNEHRASLRKVMSIILIIILQRIFKSFIFSCPCPKLSPALLNNQSRDALSSYPITTTRTDYYYYLNDHVDNLLLDSQFVSTNQYRRRYALVYLLIPALCIYIIAFCVNMDTWKILTGCCREPSELVVTARAENKKILSRPMVHHTHKPNLCGCRAYPADLSRITIKPLIPALFWIIISLMDGKFLVCGYSTTPCDSESLQSRGVRSKSQTLGWILLALVCGLLMAGPCFGAIFSRRNYYEKQFLETYLADEENEIEKMALIKSKELAAQRAEWFFNMKSDNATRWWENLQPEKSKINNVVN